MFFYKNNLITPVGMKVAATRNNVSLTTKRVNWIKADLLIFRCKIIMSKTEIIMYDFIHRFLF